MTNVLEQIDAYLASQPAAKREDMKALHAAMLVLFPHCRQSFLDGKDDRGKVVANPNIGYGHQVLDYAGGRTREFYQVGMSANTGGISLYIMGLEDRKYLSQTYGQRLGKASVTGYCIKFRKLADVDRDVLESVLRDAMARTGTSQSAESG